MPDFTASPQPEQRPPLARLARDTTRDNPWPMALVAEKIKGYVDKMTYMWVEGQVVEYRPRPAGRMAFFKLRDLNAEASMQVTCFAPVLDHAEPGFEEGARVVVYVKPVFWERSGQLNLQAGEIHVQGIGNLLAQIEATRRRLDAEGLFAASRKKPLPFLPRTVGLICGHNAKAKDDVMVNATARWPGVRFEVREVAVQGVHCVDEVSAALVELDQFPQVDVIVVARGGGAVEDLLPFSDERMVRTAASVTTPVVSAIGHEGDAPLLDLVADYRASTPTDAARRIVPDLNQELTGLTNAQNRLNSAVLRVLARQRQSLDQLATRPVLQRPTNIIDQYRSVIDAQTMRLHAAVNNRLSREHTGLARAFATLTAVSPQATLERGYSILRLPDGSLLRDASLAKKGQLLEGILAHGRLVAQVFGTNPNATSEWASASASPTGPASAPGLTSSTPPASPQASASSAASANPPSSPDIPTAKESL